MIDKLHDFFGDLPPQVAGIFIGLLFLGLMVFCGVSLGFVSGILALFISQSGTVFIGAFIIPIALFSLYGLFMCIKLIKSGYAQTNVND